MKVFVADNYEEMSRMALQDVLQLMQLRTEPLICVASGDSPAGLYSQLVDEVRNKRIDVSHWNFVGLDEWVGLNGSDEGSCRYHLDNQLFNPLHVAEAKLRFFDGRAADMEKEIEEVESFIEKNNDIDVAIVGLGLNGHIGMNEPGTDATSRSHIAKLDPTTIQVAQKYFTGEQELTFGVTLGLETIFDAKHILLLVSGAKKAAIVKLMLEAEISTQIPATLFRTHPGLRIYLDKEAATLVADQLENE
ncbi:glucosamine-6-phosphate deaminase [Flavihumibacter solisilvae]|uniref:Glucosamine/galactosamine-6-phosphate isomerase domain-containing protein n=1 Tax=Flavihumibacter solisilvae TaxID=1349421 RepID=A0A0C1IWX7_9BACT|nr:glucosamine-6-phosphate deaminase [Flavihumibacter solisilvae]KIC94974.1 hypothetical protein OI18_08780 [Flavihumibacter solisilvae]